MVYTGKLPLGKLNVSRIVAAADSLQMFDVAVGFKHVLSSLVNQQPPVSVSSTHSPNLNMISKPSSMNLEGSSSLNSNNLTSDKMDLKEELEKESFPRDRDDAEEPALKRACVHLPDKSGQFLV